MSQTRNLGRLAVARSTDAMSLEIAIVSGDETFAKATDAEAWIRDNAENEGVYHVIRVYSSFSVNVTTVRKATLHPVVVSKPEPEPEPELVGPTTTTTTDQGELTA